TDVEERSFLRQDLSGPGWSDQAASQPASTSSWGSTAIGPRRSSLRRSPHRTFRRAWNWRTEPVSAGAPVVDPARGTALPGRGSEDGCTCYKKSKDPPRPDASLVDDNRPRKLPSLPTETRAYQ